MVTATMVLARLGPSTATTRMASTRLGTARIKSIRRLMVTSSAWPRLPLKATHTRPSATPMTNDTPITASPMNSEMRAPCTSRVSMSRPRLSVPRMKRGEPPATHIGGARTASRNCSVGE